MLCKLKLTKRSHRETIKNAKLKFHFWRICSMNELCTWKALPEIAQIKGHFALKTGPYLSVYEYSYNMIDTVNLIRLACRFIFFRYFVEENGFGQNLFRFICRLNTKTNFVSGIRTYINARFHEFLLLMYFFFHHFFLLSDNRN